LDLGEALDQRRLRLAQGRLEGPRVDGEEQVALADLLSFLEVHLEDLAADL
jgi:hypothetical protein